MKNLGFGMMRLPVKNNDPTDFDYEQLNKMVDAFLEAGYTYFDTSYVYHNGKSEEATRKAVVERHPRDSFTVATKFPTFNLVPEEQIDGVFQSQLDNLGVDYIDYYLLHNIQNEYYDGLDGKGGIVAATHLFDHAKKWKEDGKIRHLGISFHSSARLLDRVLTEHPEIEFVQIALNPIDWDSELVQAGPCYEVIRRHGRKVIIMEAVKGGGLAKLPAEAEAVLKAVHSDWSIASWAVRFCLEKEDVIAVLSGMSTLEQVKDNTKTSDEAQPLTEEENKALAEAMRIYRESAPIKQSEIDKYKGLRYHGVPVTAILQAYSICQIQPNPGFSDDNNYLKNAIAEAEHVDFRNGLEKQTVVAEDGTDITEMVEKAVAWLTKTRSKGIQPSRFLAHGEQVSGWAFLISSCPIHSARQGITEDTEYQQKSYLCDLENSCIIEPVQKCDYGGCTYEPAIYNGGTLWQMPICYGTNSDFREMDGSDSALFGGRPDPLQ